jgi:hypothetical protein
MSSSNLIPDPVSLGDDYAKGVFGSTAKESEEPAGLTKQFPSTSAALIYQRSYDKSVTG